MARQEIIAALRSALSAAEHGRWATAERKAREVVAAFDGARIGKVYNVNTGEIEDVYPLDFTLREEGGE